MAKVTIGNRTVEVSDGEAENFLEPFIRRRSIEHLSGKMVFVELGGHNLEPHIDRIIKETYGPMFLVGKACTDPQRSLLYVPQVYIREEHLNPIIDFYPIIRNLCQKETKIT